MPPYRACLKTKPLAFVTAQYYLEYHEQPVGEMQQLTRMQKWLREGTYQL